MTGASTLPFSWYVDEEQLRRERARIFATSWQYAGRVADVAPPNSFLAVDAGGVPILVTRDGAGRLRAFVNVCRHRGAVLTEGCGRRSTVQCDYHGWTYGLDGPCGPPRGPTGSPASTRATGRSFRRASANGGRSSSSTRPQTAPRSPTTSATSPSCWRARSKSTSSSSIRGSQFGASANWKIVVENFLECYHCPTAHPGFSDEVDVHPDRYLLEAHPTFGAQFCRSKSSSERGQFHLLYPNTRHQRVPRAAESLDRADRTRGPDPHAALPGLLLRAGGRPGLAESSSSASTTRSARRTPRSSNRCSAECRPGRSSTGACC